MTLVTTKKPKFFLGWMTCACGRQLDVMVVPAIDSKTGAPVCKTCCEEQRAAFRRRLSA